MARDHAAVAADDEDAALERRGLELGEVRQAARLAQRVGLLDEARDARRRSARRGRDRAAVVAMIEPSASMIATSTTCEEISVRSASAWGASMAPEHTAGRAASGDSGVRLSGCRSGAAKFFADRGTHLAAMIAYFALLSFVPLLFLSLVAARRSRTRRTRARSSCASCSGRSRARRSTRSCARCGRSRTNATALGIVGAAFLLWSSLSLFSVLESAFNIVYGRPNRGFLRGKALASLMMVGSLVVLFAALVVGLGRRGAAAAARGRRRQRGRSRRS